MFAALAMAAIASEMVAGPSSRLVEGALLLPWLPLLVQLPVGLMGRSLP
jgi:hypothetical protein